MVPSNLGCGSTVFAAMATLAPSRAAFRPMARPMPRDPPVMNSVLPFSDMALVLPATGYFSRTPHLAHKPPLTYRNRHRCAVVLNEPKKARGIIHVSRTFHGRTAGRAEEAVGRPWSHRPRWRQPRVGRRGGKDRRQMVVRRPKGYLPHVVPPVGAGSHRAFPRSRGRTQLGHSAADIDRRNDDDQRLEALRHAQGHFAWRPGWH